MAELGAFLGTYGEQGLVFTILVTVIFFMGKMWMRERKLREKSEKKFNDHLLTDQKEHLSATLKFSQSIDMMSEKLTIVIQKMN